MRVMLVRRGVRPARVLALAAALAGPAAGCSSAAGGGGGGRGRATVAFVNQELGPVTVYAIGRSGGFSRVGSVAGGQTTRLRIPASMANSTVNIAARPIAESRVATSGPITLSPGSTWTVTLPMSQSILTVLPGLP